MTNYINEHNITRSLEAQAVFEAGKQLRIYYHETADKAHYLANASLYDIREYFQGRNPKTNRMNNSSDDQHYNLLIGNLRDKLKYLASKISEKVYEYEFLKR